MLKVLRSLLRLVLEDKVAPEEALSKTVDKDDLLRKFKVAGVEIAVT